MKSNSHEMAEAGSEPFFLTRRQISILARNWHHFQKMKLRGQLFTGVAHDLRNLLLTINGYSDVLLHSLPASEDTARLLKEIYVAGERAEKLCSQLLSVGQKEVPRVFDMSDLVLNLSKLLQSLLGENIVLQTENESYGCPVRGDPAAVAEVIFHLALNAREAMPQGGGVTLTVASVAIAEKMQPNHNGQFVRVTMEDNGRGIPPEQLAQLFEPFLALEEGGESIGLGLATSQEIVRENQGWMEVESELGRGTIFKIFFPAVADAANESSTKSKKPGLAGDGETILLVEDEASVRTLASIVLQQNGYRVLEASNAEEALEVWSRHRQRIGLLFTDVVMTGEMTGKELAGHLISEKPSLRIVYTSGYADGADAKPSSPERNALFIQKPYYPRSLADVIHAAFNQRKGGN